LERLGRWSRATEDPRRPDRARSRLARRQRGVRHRPQGIALADFTIWIRERSPVTVAAFMEAALYHPDFGYYARAVQRSGRAGDFFTSVDVGPLFGELLAVQIAEMGAIVGGSFDLVEAGAGNGRLSADILRALRRDAPSIYER